LEDSLIAGDEYFVVQLSNPDKATIADDEGMATIKDNEFSISTSIPGLATNAAGEKIATIQWNNDFDKQTVQGGTYLYDYQVVNHQNLDDDVVLVTVTLTGAGVTGSWKVDYTNKLRVRRYFNGGNFALDSGVQSAPITIAANGTTIQFKLEGIVRSANAYDAPFEFTFTPAGQPNAAKSDLVKFNVVNVDLSFFTIMEWWEEEVETTDPTGPTGKGGFIQLNNDFDEQNQNAGSLVPDNQPHNGTHRIVESDNETVIAGLTLDTAGADGKWWLKIPDNIKVWNDFALTEIVSEQKYDITDSISILINVEGLSLSGAIGDAALEAFFTPDETPNTTLKDRSELTVLDVDLAVVGLAEKDEEKSGNFVQLNDDFDENQTDDDANPESDLASPEKGIVGNDNELLSATLTISGPAGVDGLWFVQVSKTVEQVNQVGGITVIYEEQSPFNTPFYIYDDPIIVWWNDAGSWKPAPTATIMGSQSPPLSFTTGDGPIDLRIEGLNPADLAEINLYAVFEPNVGLAQPDNKSYAHAYNIVDLVVLNLLAVDLDIDSDNDGSLDGSTWEEELEDNPYGLGKVISFDSPTTAPTEIHLKLAPNLDPQDPNFKIRLDWDAVYASMWKTIYGDGGNGAAVDQGGDRIFPNFYYSLVLLLSLFPLMELSFG